MADKGSDLVVVLGNHPWIRHVPLRGLVIDRDASKATGPLEAEVSSRGLCVSMKGFIGFTSG